VEGTAVIRRLRHLAAVGALGLALTACGQDAEEPVELEQTTDEEAPEADTPDEDADDTSAEDAADAPGSAVVATGTTDLGEVLVDGDGMTLYLFDPDEQGPSTCDDACATNWPPLITDGEPAADGDVDEGLLGTVERDDGAVQVTYDGWPLYRWAADQEPGEATGQAVQDVWWVLDADGVPLRDAAATDDEAETSPSY
jgi:predicted lipoprotein with Yx(FWY)xxD motif